MTNPVRLLRDLPVTIRAPMLVATLMIVVAVIASQQVLSRLSQTQTNNLSGLTSAYLDGLSAAVIPHVLRNDVWEVFDALDRSRGKYKALRPMETIVADAQGRIIASSEPRKLASQSPVPNIYQNRFSDGASLQFGSSSQRAYVRRDLQYQDRKIGTIYATLNVAHLMQERQKVFWELVLTNLVLAIFLAGIGYLAVRRMLKPVKVLADHLEQGASGQIVKIPSGLLAQKHSEFGRLFRNYNALAKAVNERAELADRLAREEHLASLGRMAAGMAHEINNPLGGLFNAVDTLRKHGDKPAIRKSSLSLLERGLSGIRDVVSAALANYRPDRNRRNLTTKDIDDLSLLLQPELRRRDISLDWKNNIEDELPVQATPVRQVVLNLLLNAVAASPRGTSISMRADFADNMLVIAVGDSGVGLPQQAREFITSTAEDAVPVVEGSGIGLWMVQRLMRETGGVIEVAKSAFGGTLITSRIKIEAQAEALDHAA